MKKIFVFCLLVVVAQALNGTKLGVLSDVLRPELLEVKGDKIYVVEGASFFVYSSKDLSLIRKFGRKGEGPGEVSVIPSLSNEIIAYPDFLFVVGMNKVIFFSHEGKMKQEKRKQPQLFRVFPVGDNFVGHKIETDEKQQSFSVIILLDSNLKKKKELYKEVSGLPRRRELNMVPETIQFAVSADKIFIEESKKGFVIEVFDKEGNKISTIKKNVEPLKLGESHKQSILKDFRADTLVKMQVKQVGGWDEFKKFLKMSYPDTFPVIRDIIVPGNRIYVQTFKEKNGKVEYYVMDIDGKNKKSIFLPKVKEPSVLSRIVGKGTRYFDFDNNKFYYLYENEDEEEWEVHLEMIK